MRPPTLQSSLQLATLTGLLAAGAAAAREAPGAPPASVDGAQGSRATRPAARTRLLREGSFVTGRNARLEREGREWTFVFEPEEGAPALPPMIVFPGQRLTEMQRLVESRVEPISFILTGEVFTYKDRNYILPIVFSVDSGVTPGATSPPPTGGAPGASGSTGASSPPGAPPRAANPNDPAVADLLDDVERGSGPRREIAPGEGRGADVEPVAGARREGELVKSRRARARRSPAGDWLLTFDNDAPPPVAGAPTLPPVPSPPPAGADASPPRTDAAPQVDPPMTLLPCQTLTRLEAIALRSPDGLLVTISGQVFLYDGQNYLLPTLFVVDYSDASGLRSAH